MNITFSVKKGRKSLISFSFRCANSFSLLSTLSLYSSCYRGPFSFLSKTPFAISLIYLKISSLLLDFQYSCVFYILLRTLSRQNLVFFRLHDKINNLVWTFMLSNSCLEFETCVFGIPNIGLSTWTSRGLDPFVRELVENRKMRRQISLLKGKKGPRSLKKKFQN